MISDLYMRLQPVIVKMKESRKMNRHTAAISQFPMAALNGICVRIVRLFVKK